MMGTRIFCLSSSSTMRGTAAAASSLLTVTRTSSDPARARAAHCWTVEGISAVSVLVMDCTTIGASEPTRTPPTATVTVFLRGIIAMGTNSLSRKPMLARRPHSIERAESCLLQAARQPWNRLHQIVVDHHDSEQHQKHECCLIDAFLDVQADVAAH